MFGSKNESEEIINSTNSLSQDYLLHYLNITDKIVHFMNKDSITKDYQKIEYQSQLLEKIFKKECVLSIIEYLDLESLPWQLLVMYIYWILYIYIMKIL